MPTYSSYDGIELTYPNSADWADAENVVAKDGQTFNMTPAQFATLAQVGMAASDAEWAISSITGLQAELDAKRNTADPVPHISEDAGNAITEGADGLAYLSDELLGGDFDLAGYATIVYVDAAVAAVDLTPFATTTEVTNAIQAQAITTADTYATIATVDALDASVEAQLSAIADALEGI